MPDSLIIDWLNENQYRAYPLKNRGTKIFQTTLSLDTMVLDANLIFHGVMAVDAVVNFTSITISGSDAAIVLNNVGSFSVPSYQTATYPYYCRASNGSLLVLGQDFASVNANVTFSDVEFEPSTITAFDPYWYGVKSISFNSTLINDPIITFEPGFQIKLTADEALETITIGANSNYGTPIGCDAYFPGVTKDCDDIISYINGIGVANNGASLSLTAGSNLAIYNDVDNHRIYVGLNFEANDICSGSNPRPSPNIL